MPNYSLDIGLDHYLLPCEVRLEDASPLQREAAKAHAARKARLNGGGGGPPRQKSLPAASPAPAKGHPARLSPEVFHCLYMFGLQPHRRLLPQPSRLMQRGIGTKAMMRYIVKAVALDYRLTRDELLMPRRHKVFVQPRQHAMHLCYQVVPSFPLVGHYFKRDHTTIMHARRTIEHRLANDPDFAARHRRLKERLGV